MSTNNTMNSVVHSFTFENKTFHYVRVPNDDDIHNDSYFCGRDVIKYLGYASVKKTLEKKVPENCKFKLSDLINNCNDDTIYISQSGLIYLENSANQEKRKDLFSHWYREIYLENFCSKNKDCSLKLDTSSYKSFYDDNKIADYDHKNVCYLGAIGLYGGAVLMKWGKSGRVLKRDVEEHRRTFGPQFKMVHIVQTDNNDNIEKLFAEKIKDKDLSVEMEFNGTNRTELFVTSNRFTLENAIKLLNELVEKNPLLAVEIERVKRLELELQIKKTEVDFLSKYENVVKKAEQLIAEKIEKLENDSSSVKTLKNVELQLKKVDLRILEEENKRFVNNECNINLSKETAFDMAYLSNLGKDYFQDMQCLIKKLKEYDGDKYKKDIREIHNNIMSNHKTFMKKYLSKVFIENEKSINKKMDEIENPENK